MNTIFSFNQKSNRYSVNAGVFRLGDCRIRLLVNGKDTSEIKWKANGKDTLCGQNETGKWKIRYKYFKLDFLGHVENAVKFHDPSVLRTELVRKLAVISIDESCQLLE